MPKPTAPPTAREGTIEGTKKRQEMAGAATDTNTTGGSGDTSAASTYKSKLGQ